MFDSNCCFLTCIQVSDLVSAKCKVAQSCQILSDPPWTVACQASLSMELPKPGYWSGYLFPSPRDPNPETEPKTLALQAIYLLSEPPGKPKNTGVRSLSLLQGISQSQDSNWRLLHCRRILDQLSYQGMLFVKVTANALTLPPVHQLPKVRRTNLYFLLQPET